MHIVTELGILASFVTCAACAGAIVRRAGEANKQLHRLLTFLDSAHVDHRRALQDNVVATSAFCKTLTDDLRGCRNSIDAIRSTTDELSEHRRETVELRASPTRPPRTDPPPRSMTKIGAAVPAAPRALPTVVPPPMPRPRSAVTLPSMGAIPAMGDPPGDAGERRSP